MIQESTNQPHDVSFQLTNEELRVILILLDQRVIAGLNTDALDQLDLKTRNIILETARRGLIARKILSHGDQNQVRVDPLILTLITACIVPETTTIIIRNVTHGSEGDELHYFHYSGEVTVAHTPLADGFHRFIWRREPDPIVASARTIMRLNGHMAVSAEPITIAERHINEARDAGSRTEIESILMQAGIPSATVQSLAVTLASAHAYTTIAHIKHATGNETRSQDGLTVLDGANGVWILQPVASSSIRNALKVKPVSSEEAIQTIKQLITT